MVFKIIIKCFLFIGLKISITTLRLSTLIVLMEEQKQMYYLKMCKSLFINISNIIEFKIVCKI